MDIETMVQQLIGATTQEPSTLGNLLAHPYSTIEEVTGVEEVSKDDASQALTAFSALAAGKTIDFDNLASLASGILAENDNSVHTLANSLLGDGQDRGIDITNGIAESVMSNLAGVMFSGNTCGVDLSDGIGLDDILGLAGMFLGGSK